MKKLVAFTEAKRRAKGSIRMKRPVPTRRNGCLIMLTGLAGASGYALAQQATQNPEGGLEEITVTATRHEQSVSKVPISLTAFSQEQMDAVGISRIDDVAAFTPGLNIQRRGGAGGENTNITIRGINTNTGVSTTGVYIDDTPIQIRQQGSAFSIQNNYPDIFDLERVEVLRGPQGTLFGEGSMGGTVRFITPTPSLTTYSAYSRANAAYTENGGPSWSFGAAGGGPIINDVLGFRVSAYLRDDGGYVDRVPHANLVQQYELGAAAPTENVEKNANWAQSYSFHLAFLGKVGDNFTINPSFNYQHDYQNNVSAFWTYFSDPDSGRFVNPGPFDSSYTGESWLASVKLSYDLPGMTLISNTSLYSGWEVDLYDQTVAGILFTPAGPPAGFGPLFQLPNDPNYSYAGLDPDNRRSLTEEIRLQSSTQGRFNWTVGFFYNKLEITSQDFGLTSQADDDALAQYFGYPNALALFGVPLFDASRVYPGTHNTNYEVYEKSYDRQYAGFGQVSVKIFEPLVLTAGVRVANQYYKGTNLTGGQYAGTAGLEGFTSTEKETPVTPKFGAEYHLDDRNMVYVSAAKGVRAGGGNPALGPSCTAGLQALGLQAAPKDFSTDEVWSYELGLKSRWLDNRMSFNASVYTIDWTGIQTSTFVTDGCNQTITFNANSARSRGFDMDTSAKVTSDLTLGASLGFNEAVYTKPLIAGGTTLISAGDWLPFAIPWQGAGFVNYDFRLLDHSAFFRTDIAVRGSKRTIALTNPNDALFKPEAANDPSYTDVTAHLGMTLSDGWVVKAFAKNLLNQHPIYHPQVGDGTSYYPIILANTERPRTIGLEAEFHY